ncbi:MAG: nucleoside hydrolase [Bryobacteraceae bacterium]|nr:nucleoside hydrolase [Bryobacteraceae bacterium]
MNITRRRWVAGIPALLPFAAAAQTSSAQRLSPPVGKVEAILDTDTYNEIDDQFAVAYAIRSSDRIDLKAVYAAPYLNERSTSAGDGMRKSYDEILRILERLKTPSDKFAYRGSDRFMAGSDKPVDSAAAQDLVRKAMMPREQPLYVIAIGAPTNVSSALLMEPKIRDRIVVVWLGGQPFDWPTASEFNLKQDVYASQLLYDSGVALVNVPAKNVSEHLRTTVLELQHFLKGKSPIADYLHAEFVKYAEHDSPSVGYAYSKVIWDISAVAWLVNPKWVPTKVVPSPVLTQDLKYRAKAGRHSVAVATDVDRDAVFNDLFRKLTR